MKIISSVLFFILFTAALGQTSESTSTVTSQSTSSASSTEVTTTTSDKSTPSTLEPTTAAIESTTRDISTATTPTTTSSSTTVSSTDVPTSTSSPVTSTETPEDAPCPFNVTEGNVTCIRADLKAKFFIDVDGNTTTIKLGCDATTYAGGCSSSNDTQTLVLSKPTYTLSMVFEKKAGKVLVNNVTFTYNLPELPSGSGSNNSQDLFNVKDGNSYKCKSKFNIYLDNITMEVEEVHIQAFIEEGKGYGAIQECDADEKVSDIVPIAVGVALAALIIIVLIAYLVGRRRSRQKGYQSV